MRISDELRRVHIDLYRVREQKLEMETANTFGQSRDERIERDLLKNLVNARYDYLFRAYQELLKVAAENQDEDSQDE